MRGGVIVRQLAISLLLRVLVPPALNLRQIVVPLKIEIHSAEIRA
jgi:hypothetical protein